MKDRPGHGRAPSRVKRTDCRELADKQNKGVAFKWMLENDNVGIGLCSEKQTGQLARFTLICR